MAKKKQKKTTVTVKKLSAAAEELNNVIGPEPPIDPSELSKDDLSFKVKQAAGLLDPENDELEEDTWETLKAAGFVDGDGKPTEEAQQAAEQGDEEEEQEDDASGDDDEGGEEGEDEEEGGEEDDEQDRPPEDLKALIDDCSKLKELKEVANKYETFSDLDVDKYKKLEGYKQLRADMLEIIGYGEGEGEDEEDDSKSSKSQSKGKKSEGKSKKSAEGKKQQKKTAPPANNGGTKARPTCVGEAMVALEEATTEELVEKTDEIYQEAGGTSNTKESRACVNIAVKGLMGAGVVQKTDEGKFQVC